MHTLATGKKPATQDDRDFLVDRLVDRSALPTPPDEFGHEKVRRSTGWGMLGNDEWGDCVFAGGGHETELLTAGTATGPKGGVRFLTRHTLSDYSAVTGFDENAGPPGQNPTDQGTNVRDAAGYRRTTGLLDAHGTRHLLKAYLKASHEDPAELALIANASGVVGLGIAFPDSAMQQFDNGEPWDVVAGEPDPQDGHYVVYAGRRRWRRFGDALMPVVLTWAHAWPATEAFLARYVDEAFVYVPQEAAPAPWLNVAELEADLSAL